MVTVGRVRKAHGIQGELSVGLVEIDADGFSSLQTVSLVADAGRREERRVMGARKGPRGALLVSLEGVDDRDLAGQRSGWAIQVPEGALPARDDHYFFQLEGLEVFDGDGRALGRVINVFNAGASDVAVVKWDDREWMFPVVDAVVRSVDQPAGRIVVEPMEGLLEAGSPS